MVNMNDGEKTKEELVSGLMQHVQMLIYGRYYPDNKRLAVERYMRSYLRALTLGELRAYINLFKRRGILQPDVVHKVDQASEGYDNYVMGNRKRYSR